MAQGGGDQLGCLAGHCHGAILEGLADAEAATVDAGSDAYLRHNGPIKVLRGSLITWDMVDLLKIIVDRNLLT